MIIGGKQSPNNKSTIRSGGADVASSSSYSQDEMREEVDSVPDEEMDLDIISNHKEEPK
jgi:hypothetical protein